MLNFPPFWTFGVHQSMNFCRSEIYPWFSYSIFSPGTCSEKNLKHGSSVFDGEIQGQEPKCQSIAISSIPVDFPDIKVQ